jgi:uncharacterized protein DUF1153
LPKLPLKLDVTIIASNKWQVHCLRLISDWNAASMKKYPPGLPDEFGNVTMDSLPPADTKRWIVRRKATVVAALRQGLLTRDEACERYNLSLHELESWEETINRHGLPGLRVTLLKQYRGPNPLIRLFTD